jgi:hypothetical protein
VGTGITSLAQLMKEDLMSPPCLHSAPTCLDVPFKVSTNVSACLQSLQSKMQPESLAQLPLNLHAGCRDG